MSKPPKTTPSSDIDGVHEDERRSVDAANDAGQTSEDLAEAHSGSAARPRYSKEKSADNRTE